MLSSLDLRLNFKSIYAKYAKLKKGNVRLTQSSLILIQNIDSTKSNYVFDVLDNQISTLNPLEIRLNQNDEFLIGELGIYLLGTVGESVGIGANPIAPINKYFTTAPVELNRNYLKSGNLYDGKLKIGVNNIIYVENWDLQKHQYRGQTQYQLSTAAVPAATLAELDMKNDGMYPMQPLLTLSGAKKNEVSISLPKAIDISTSNTFIGEDGSIFTIEISKIALVCRGMLAQNASAFQ